MTCPNTCIFPIWSDYNWLKSHEDTPCIELTQQCNVIDNTTIYYIAKSTCSHQAIRGWIGGVTREKKYAKKPATRRASTTTSDAWLFDLAVSAGLGAVLDRRAPAPLVRSEAHPGLRWNSNAGTTEGLDGAFSSKQVLSNFHLEHKLNKFQVMAINNLAAMIPIPTTGLIFCSEAQCGPSSC